MQIVIIYIVANPDQRVVAVKVFHSKYLDGDLSKKRRKNKKQKQNIEQFLRIFSGVDAFLE